VSAKIGRCYLADWTHLTMLDDIDSQAVKSKETKLTEKHPKPNSFEKMSVKLATQVFSLTTSAAMRTAVLRFIGQWRTTVETSFICSRYSKISRGDE
jgi:hypothetical protein